MSDYPSSDLNGQAGFLNDGDEMIEETLCPECNGPMISRKSNFGVFWGCKNYPKCKGTRDNQGRSKADREKWKQEQEEKEEQQNSDIKEIEHEVGFPFSKR